MGEVRVGDNAEMCLMELVDFNTLYTKDGASKKAKTRRSRRGKKGEEGAETPADEAVVVPAPEAKEEKKAKKATPKKSAPKKDKE